MVVVDRARRSMMLGFAAIAIAGFSCGDSSVTRWLAGEPLATQRVHETADARWGHMRHAVIVYATAPELPPTGFFVRSASPRTWVIANES